MRTLEGLLRRSPAFLLLPVRFRPVELSRGYNLKVCINSINGLCIFINHTTTTSGPGTVVTLSIRLHST